MAPTGGRRSSTGLNADGNASSDWQVQASNSTLNSFLGGRRQQPSWLTNAKPVKPTPRPPPPPPPPKPPEQPPITTDTAQTTKTTQSIKPAQITRTEQPVVTTTIAATATATATTTTAAAATTTSTTTQPASVAASAPKATTATSRRNQPPPPRRPSVHIQTSSSFIHPAANTVLLSPAPSDEPSPGNAESHTTPFITEARFVLDKALDEGQNSQGETQDSTVRSRKNSRPRQNSGKSKFEVSAPKTSTPTNVALNTPPTPNMPSLNVNIAPREQLVQPQAKRPCVRLLPYQFLLQLGASKALQVQLAHTGLQNATNEELQVERARYLVLREACEVGDLFFTTFHQLFCIWSINHVNVLQLCVEGRHYPALLDNAFGIMSALLKSNSGIQSHHLHWLASFPKPLGIVLDYPIYKETVLQVLDFLTHLAQKWHLVNHDRQVRGYPLLMSELLFVLHLRSPILQGIMFRASRRSLGIKDGIPETQAEEIFRADQKAHMTPDGTFILHPPSPTDYHLYNNSRIASYQHVMAQYQVPFGRGSYKGGGQQPVPSSSPTAQQTGFYHGVSVATSGNQLPYTQSPVASPSPIPTSAPSAGTYLRAPVPSQYTLPSNQNGFDNSATTTPTTANFTLVPPQFQRQQQQVQQQQVLERRSSLEQVSRMTPVSRQSSLNPAGPYHGPLHIPTAGQSSHAVQNHVDQPWLRPQPVSSPGVQTANHGVFAPNPGNGAPQPMQAMNRSQGPYHYQQSPTFGTLPQPQAVPPGSGSLIPPPGRRIDLPDYPFSPYDIRSVHMSLHQAHLRSPRRMPRELDQVKPERYYQAVKCLVLDPVPTSAQPYVSHFKFTVSDGDYANISKDRVVPGEALPTNVFRNGSTRFRLRCCQTKKKSNPFSEGTWVTTDTFWPEHYFADVNDNVAVPMRKAHYSKDLPIEISDAVVAGENHLNLVITQDGPVPPKYELYTAVELVEILSHSSVLKMVQTKGRITADVTLEVIRSRLAGSSSSDADDELTMVDPYLPIDLADPFSRVVFSIPVRGKDCTHLECFDLETWLNSRLGKKCGACNKTSGCPRCASEPSFVDKWRCPLCDGDARPYSLRVDEYLVDVRAQLEREGKLGTKCILVSADGTWKPKDEPADDDDSDAGSDGDGSGHTKAKVSKSERTTPRPREQPAIEIIEID